MVRCETIRLTQSLTAKEKTYRWALATHGLEMGIGSPGIYEAHAHLHFVDLIYSPYGVGIGEAVAPLVIVPPRVSFGPTRTGPFFFLKFLPNGGDHSIPDKVTGQSLLALQASELIELCAAPMELSHEYFDPVTSTLENLDLHLNRDALRVESSRGWGLHVVG